eukprot:2921445-Heterocapsa_arctica.AAC.1
MPTLTSHGWDLFSVRRFTMRAFYDHSFGVALLRFILLLPARSAVGELPQSTCSRNCSCYGGPAVGSSLAQAHCPADMTLPLRACVGGGPGLCVAWPPSSLPARSPGML